MLKLWIIEKRIVENKELKEKLKLIKDWIGRGEEMERKRKREEGIGKFKDGRKVLKIEKEEKKEGNEKIEREKKVEKIDRKEMKDMKFVKVVGNIEIEKKWENR